MSKAIHEQAKRLHTHKVTFTKTDDVDCAALAMAGWSTKAIASELGISESQAQYRIAKAQKSIDSRFRQEYRGGTSKFAKLAARLLRDKSHRFIATNIAPKFQPHEDR